MRPALLTYHWPGLLRFLPGCTERPAFTPVAASVGVPRALPWARSLRASEITPWGLVGKAAEGTPPDEWERRYLARLERHGVEKIQARFDMLDAEYGGPLVLLCWEPSVGGCHRGMFARWWQQRTGQHVPEAHGLDPLSLLAALGKSSL